MSAEQQFQVVFVLGGPGAGKGTNCEKIVNEFGFLHLSAGDLLRAAQASGTEEGEMIKNYIKEGQIVPVEVTVRLLLNAMKESGKSKFLIDGFPRNQNNVDGWESVVGTAAKVEFVLYLDCPEDVMEARLLDRGKTSGRTDDNIESIKKRFRTYMQETMQVINAFDARGLVKRVDSNRDPEAVYASVQELFVPFTQ
eukprot:JP446743.1.p1 GENE.JP446743.1~~JP446743.1.p1  ORF type:complete len:196 (-),score=51.17 JP446743.1:270-857(-)